MASATERPKCRSEVLRQQRHEANRRYQQSEPGRESYRRCQKRHRERVLGPSVKYQGAAVIHSAGASQAADHVPVHDLRSTQPLDRSEILPIFNPSSRQKSKIVF